MWGEKKKLLENWSFWKPTNYLSTQVLSDCGLTTEQIKKINFCKVLSYFWSDRNWPASKNSSMKRKKHRHTDDREAISRDDKVHILGSLQK